MNAVINDVIDMDVQAMEDINPMSPDDSERSTCNALQGCDESNSLEEKVCPNRLS